VHLCRSLTRDPIDDEDVPGLYCFALNNGVNLFDALGDVPGPFPGNPVSGPGGPVGPGKPGGALVMCLPMDQAFPRHCRLSHQYSQDQGKGFVVGNR
jgi:hypothetical protein